MWHKETKKIQNLFVLGCLIGLGAFCEAFTLTLEDVTEGINLRQTKVTSIELQYSIKNVNEDAYYEKLNKDFERMKSFAKEGDRVDLPVKENQSTDRVSENMFQIFVNGNKKAYQTYDVDSSTKQKVLTSKAVYDGENFKFLNVPQLNGVVERRLPEDVIKFPTIPKMLGLEGYDLGDYMNNKGIEIEIIKESVVDGDLIVELTLKRSFMPSPESPVEVVTEHQVKLNASKDFWPIQIDRYIVIKNIRTGENSRSLTTSVKVSGFIENNGIYYPKSFESIEYDHDFKYESNNFVPTILDTKVISKMSLNTEKLKVNQDIPDSVFEFDFPAGTRFHDSIGGFGMIVSDDPDKLAQYMVDSMDSLSVDLFTESEARGILQLRRKESTEEAERLKESILAKKKGITTGVENGKIENVVPKETSTSSDLKNVQVPVVYSNEVKKSLSHYLILATLFCVTFGLMFVFLRKRNK